MRIHLGLILIRCITHGLMRIKTGFVNSSGVSPQNPPSQKCRNLGVSPQNPSRKTGGSRTPACQSGDEDRLHCRQYRLPFGKLSHAPLQARNRPHPIPMARPSSADVAAPHLPEQRTTTQPFAETLTSLLLAAQCRLSALSGRAGTRCRRIFRRRCRFLSL